MVEIHSAMLRMLFRVGVLGRGIAGLGRCRFLRNDKVGCG